MSDTPAIRNNPANSITIGKIPGELHTVPIDGKTKICELFMKLGIKDADRCEIQRNGLPVNLDEYAQIGDTILAVAKIKGN